MLNIFFILIGFVQLGIGIYGLRNINKKSWYAILVFIITFGLAYDNFAIAAGAFLGEGELTKTLNMPRYWIHALFTPSMMIASFGALRMMDINFAKSKVWHIIICVLATALIALGSYTDILNLTLAPKFEAGVLRYINTFEFLKGPPIPAVLTIIVVLIFGIIAWRKVGLKALFFGSLFMFLLAPQTSVPLAQNIGEVGFAIGLILTQIRAAKS
jgi:hypothetical protein